MVATAAAAAATRAATPARASPLTVRCWWYWPMRRWLCRLTMPSIGSSCPVISLSSVDLPAPLGPTCGARHAGTQGAGREQAHLPRLQRAPRRAARRICGVHAAAAQPSVMRSGKHTHVHSSTHNGDARVQVSTQVDVAVQHLAAGGGQAELQMGAKRGARLLRSARHPAPARRPALSTLSGEQPNGSPPLPPPPQTDVRPAATPTTGAIERGRRAPTSSQQACAPCLASSQR